MNDLASVLDALVADAPIDRQGWEDVEARRRGIERSPHRPHKRLALAFAAILALAVAGSAIGIGVGLLDQQERFHATVPDDPERRGPLVEVASGDEWALIAWKSDVGVCLDFAIPGNSPYSCGFPVRGAKPATDASGFGLPTHAVAGSVSGGGLVGGDGKTTIFGVASREVTAVDVELRTGRIVRASVYDSPRELDADIRIFIVRLRLPATGLRDDGPVRALLAYDHNGRLIERMSD